MVVPNGNFKAIDAQSYAWFRVSRTVSSKKFDVSYHEKFEIAKNGYENVIAHSLSKDKIENAHLQILKIITDLTKLKKRLTLK